VKASKRAKWARYFQEKDANVFALRGSIVGWYEEIERLHGKEAAAHVFTDLAASKSERIQSEHFALARRLLTKPGRPNKYKLAKEILAERGFPKDAKAEFEKIRQQIDRAIIATRKYQENSDSLFGWGAGFRLHKKEGITFTT
jgi:hypothetical protein